MTGIAFTGKIFCARSIFPYFHTFIKQLRINQQIRQPSVTLVEESGEIRTISLEEALSSAESQGLDLVEVDGTKTPPIVKIMDYGKFLYKQRKLETKNKKMQKQVEVKSVRIGFGTGEHDLVVKEKQIHRFIEKRNQVRVFLVMKGREMSHLDLAKEKLRDFSQRFEDICKIEIENTKQNNKLAVLLTPLK